MNGNVPSVTDLNSMMIFLKNQGLRYIIIKAATSSTLYPSSSNPQFTAEVVNAGHAAGLWVFGYNRSYGVDIPGEIAVADYVFNVGADGFVFDAEIEWESHNLPDNQTKAIQLCSAVRGNWPSKFLAHAPFPIISYHSTFPYKEFGYYCDAVMPQDYWIEIGVTPTYMVDWMTTQWKNWQNGLSGQWLNSIKPIVGLGQGWSSSSGTVDAVQITEFFTALKNQVNPATAGGYKGANFWRAEYHPMQVWDAIRTNNIGTFTGAPVIANVSAGNVNSTSATITWTTDQSSDSVVEYGPDASYGSAVTNSTPIYYHTVVLNGLSASMTYHYRVRSKNSNNQTAVSEDYVFTTEAVTVPDVIVESHTSSGAVTGNPPYSDSGFLDSTLKSTAAGLNGTGSRYATGGSGTPSCTFKPTLTVAGGTYDVYLTHGSASSISTDILVEVNRSGCSGLPATTTVFRQPGGNTWELLGQMTLGPGVSVPTLSFTYLSGSLGGSARMYSDSIKFVYVPPPPQPPSIATQPQSQTNNQGNNVTFSVVAWGTPVLFYQWRFNGANIEGATSSSYTRNNIQPGDAGSYSVVITNGVGSTNSANALLTVIVPPTILVQPADKGVGSGMDATFSVTAVGTGTLQYQWRFSGTNLLGATASSYTANDVQPSKAGPHDVVISSPHGTNISDTAFLNFLDPCIATQPQDQTVAAGGAAAFSTTAVGTLPVSWQWMKQGVPLVDGRNISGAQSADLTVSDVQWADTGYFSVQVSNVYGVAVSSNAALVGPFPPTIVAQPADQTVSAGSAATFTVGAVGTGTLAFQWKRAGTDLANGTKYGGVDTTSLVVAKAQAGDMQSYSVVVSNAYGSVTSSDALLGLWPLAGWGRNNQTQADIPAGLTSVIGLAGGFYHSLALKTDGTVVAWGAGQVNSGLDPQYGQAIVPSGLTDAVGLAAGFYHSLALESNGTVVAWGAGTNNSGSYPHYGQAMVPVEATANIMAVAAGAYHSLALNSNGTVVAWGAGTNNTGVSPHYGQSAVPTGLSNVVAIAAGAYHSLALKSDGTVVAWGAGTNYTGGSPHYGQSQVPVGLSDVVAVAGGGYHSLALRADGTLAAWGAGTNDTGGSPDFGQAQVPNWVTNVAAIAGGLYHSLAVKADGTVAAWGLDNYGQTTVPNPLYNGAAIGGGGFHSLVMEGNGFPYWTIHPFSQTVAAGATVHLAARATGMQPVSYQWQRNGTNVFGASNAVLTITDAEYANGGSYALVASNALGVTTSRAALLTVISPPSITTQPQSLSVNEGSDATFTITAIGTLPLSYQWVFNGTNILGATAGSYTRFNAQLADAGTYAVVVTNALGSVTSSNALLALNVPPGITAQPESLTVVAGSNATFTVSATGTAPLSHQWVFAGTNISGAKASSYTRLNAQPTDAGTYAVIVTNAAGSITSSNAVLTVNVPPVVTSQPQSATISEGENVMFSVTAAGTQPLGYQWRFGDTAIAGETDTSYALNNAQTSHAGSYSVVVSNVAGVATSSSALLTVLPANALRVSSVTRLPDGAIELQISGGPGDFAIECSPTPSGWTQLSSLTATGAVFHYLDPETNQTSRFYRVRLLP